MALSTVEYFLIEDSRESIAEALIEGVGLMDHCPLAYLTSPRTNGLSAVVKGAGSRLMDRSMSTVMIGSPIGSTRQTNKEILQPLISSYCKQLRENRIGPQSTTLSSFQRRGLTLSQTPDQRSGDLKPQGTRHRVFPHTHPFIHNTQKHTLTQLQTNERRRIAIP